jgi:SAM-dependent methyltransferase
MNDEQAMLWNGASGRAWVEAQPILDAMFKPFIDVLAEVCSPGSSVLDIGCGTGGTTLALARRVGSRGRCLGIDISEPMIAAARSRAEREGVLAAFACADAQTHELEPAAFDAIVSRFGVMFFEDSGRAFTHLRLAARTGALLRFIAWRAPAENPFMTTAERAAAPFLPDIPPRVPDAPGQFAFADRDRVLSILKQAGWIDIEIEPMDVDCALPASALERYFTQFGPLGRVLQDTDEGTRTRIVESVRAAFGPYVFGSEVRFTAACWVADARAP